MGSPWTVTRMAQNRRRFETRRMVDHGGVPGAGGGGLWGVVFRTPCRSSKGAAHVDGDDLTKRDVIDDIQFLEIIGIDVVTHGLYPSRRKGITFRYILARCKSFKERASRASTHWTPPA
jgi:hypothetical protein